MAAVLLFIAAFLPPANFLAGPALRPPVGGGLQSSVVGNKGADLLFIAAGLAAAGAGLGARRTGMLWLGPAGWLMLLAGLVRLMVPDFF